MVMLPMTLWTPNPKPPQFLHFVAFYIFVVSKQEIWYLVYRLLIVAIVTAIVTAYGGQTVPKAAWLRHVTRFKF